MSAGFASALNAMTKDFQTLTATPFLRAGWNFHFFTAVTAARPRPLSSWIPLRMPVSMTLPFSSMRALTVIEPPTPSRWAVCG